MTDIETNIMILLGISSAMFIIPSVLSLTFMAISWMLDSWLDLCITITKKGNKKYEIRNKTKN